jgi:hypothetical protein
MNNRNAKHFCGALPPRPYKVDLGLTVQRIKPSIDDIINVILQFPIGDLRREQLWSLIIKDEDSTRQLLARLKVR